MTAALAPFLTAERRALLARVAAQRTPHVAVVLEGLFDLGNVGAVLRSADAFGVQDVHVVNPRGDRYKATRAVSAGAERWLTVRRWASTPACLAALRARGYRVVVADARPAGVGGTAAPPTPLPRLDLARATAVLLGNEHAGVSPEALAAADERFAVPMSGFVESLNVSVAAAVTLHALRARLPPAADPVRRACFLGVFFKKWPGAARLTPGA